MQQRMSLRSPERGLKFAMGHVRIYCIWSLRSPERGLKLALYSPMRPHQSSLRSPERGLKFQHFHMVSELCESRSVRRSVD